MYSDDVSPTYWKATLAAIFLLLTVPNIWLPEFNIHEAGHALAARTILESGDFFVPHIQGTGNTVTSPMTSWVLAVTGRFLTINELTVRMVGIIPLGMISVFCGFMVLAVAGRHAAAVAVAAAISSVAALKYGIRGESMMLFAMFINAAWYAWFYLSREKHNWMLAWCAAHLMLLFAVLTGGLKAILFFYFPLCLLRRPLKIWLRLRQPDHILSAATLAMFLGIWYFWSPNPPDDAYRLIHEFEQRHSTSSYFARLFVFPFLSMTRYFPWIFLAWPAFCMAFRPLEKAPVLGQFCRTIIFALFFLFWLTPDVAPDLLTPLIGPLSILIGLNYEILVRRHGRHLRRIPRILGRVTIIAAGVAWLGILTFKDDVLTAPAPLLAGVLLCVAASVVLGVLLMREKIRGSIWLTVLLAVAAIQLGATATYGIVSYQYESHKRILSGKLTARLPVDSPLYVLISERSLHPGEYVYFNNPIVPVESLRTLPIYVDTVYILTANTRPISVDRHWTAISETVTHNGLNVRIWKGEKRLLNIHPDRLEFVYSPVTGVFLASRQTVQVTSYLRDPIELEIINGHTAATTTANLTVPPGESMQLTITIDATASDTFPPGDSIAIRFEHNRKQRVREIDITIVRESEL